MSLVTGLSLGVKRAFARMDFEIWRKLWWWSYRRHPRKNAAWVRNRYYHAIAERMWRFAARTGTNPLGQPSWKRLLYAGNTPIQRHLKIKGEANPFDPGGVRIIYNGRVVRQKDKLSRMTGPPLQGAYTWLEPDEGKLSCPVLRGGSVSNDALLPDFDGLSAQVQTV